ncbi:MAG: DUF4199 domain-containing protein [Sphingorhabdus sp.]
MFRIAAIYGVISGTIAIISMLLGFAASDSQGFFSSEYFGYLIMLIALSMIFVGIKRYRDTELGGVIKFLPALGLGLAIAAIAGAMYVAIWEIYLFTTDYAFINNYVAGLIEAKKASGASAADVEKLAAEMNELKASYAKPYFRIPMTFLEIFPVGLIIALISAAILRNPKILPARQQV